MKRRGELVVRRCVARLERQRADQQLRSRPAHRETLESDPGFALRKYVPFDAYGDSKLANVLFTSRLAKV